MTRTWTTPAGRVYRLFEDMLEQDHILIAGATGSGKSVLINGILTTALYKAPSDVGLILIDPKRVELAQYARLPHTLTHAAGFNPDAWASALGQAVSIMDARYAEMERKHLRKYVGSDIYVVIDEWANVYKNGGSACYKALLRLVSEGRAARVHVIMATQIPKANIIPTEIRENFSARVCLRTNNATQSRVIMDMSGCEDLPRVGFGYYVTPEGTELYKLPYVTEDEQQSMIDYWERNSRPKLRLFS